MTFTGVQLQMFARGLSPMPHQGNMNTKNDLRDPSRESSLTLASYPQDYVLRRLQEFHGWSSGWDVATVLNHDYQDGQRNWRTMSQHGGDRDYWGSDRSLNMTYSSHTQGSFDDRHFYGMMLGAAPQGPDVIAWRDLAMVAMVPGAGFMSTGASGVAITMDELARYVQSRTGIWTTNPFELAAHLYTLNYGTPRQDLNIEQLPDGTVKAENRNNSRQGGVFVNTLLQGGLVLVVVNNVQVSPSKQARRICMPGVVPTGPQFTGLIADPTGQARDGNRDIERFIGQHGIHGFYRSANDYVRRVTGMDYRMTA